MNWTTFTHLAASLQFLKNALGWKIVLLFFSVQLTPLHRQEPIPGEENSP